MKDIEIISAPSDKYERIKEEFVIGEEAMVVEIDPPEQPRDRVIWIGNKERGEEIYVRVENFQEFIAKLNEVCCKHGIESR